MPPGVSVTVMPFAGAGLSSVAVTVTGFPPSAGAEAALSVSMVGVGATGSTTMQGTATHTHS